MSSHGSARETTDVHARYIQRRWAIILRRAGARESALKGALAHARATEAELRLQLEREQQRHTIESGLLRERLLRMEQCLLGYVAAGRRLLTTPAHRSARALGTAATRSTASALHAGSDAPVLLAKAPAPFDPVATVESLLPLSQTHVEAPETDINGALDRLQALVQSAGPPRSDGDTNSPAAPADSRPPLAAPVAPTHAKQREHLLVGDGEPSPYENHTVPSDTPWFPRAFRRLADEDPAAAGRLFLQLLPAQGLVWPEDVNYRIEVREIGTLAVDVRAGSSTVRPLLESDPSTRTGEPTLRTDLTGLARTIAGRRGWGRVGARIASSRNRHLRPLRALAAAPLELSDLKRAGVRLDPVLLLRLLALAINPEWTAEETFTVACRWRSRGRAVRGCYIHVFESAPVAVTSAPPLGRVAATLSCKPEDMLDILLGYIPLGHSLSQVGGDRAAIASLLEWFQRVDATATTIPAEPAAVAV